MGRSAAHLESDDGLVAECFGNENPVSMNPAPCRDINECAGVGAMHFQNLSRIERRHPFLGSDNRHGTDQVARIQCLVYTYHGSGISEGRIGETVNLC